MSDKCTLNCQQQLFSTVIEIAQGFFNDVTIEPAPYGWSAITVVGHDGELRLTSKIYHEDGDEFTRLRLSTYLWADNITSENQAQKETLLSTIKHCQLAIGVVAQPSFKAHENIEPFLLEILRQLDGVLFNGHAMLNFSGETLLEKRA